MMLPKNAVRTKLPSKNILWTLAANTTTIAKRKMSETAADTTQCVLINISNQIPKRVAEKAKPAFVVGLSLINVPATRKHSFAKAYSYRRLKTAKPIS